MNMMGFPGTLPAKSQNMVAFNNNEEFKMMEDEDDNVDLLNEKKKAKNLDEFYAESDLNDLKNQIMMNMPDSQSRMGHPSLS